MIMSASVDTGHSIDEISERIKAEVRRQQSRLSAGAAVASARRPKIDSVIRASHVVENIHIARLPQEIPLPIKDSYDIGEFLRYRDRAFIRNAYRGVLGREPGLEDLNNALSQLRAGLVDKADFLSILRFSDEGARRQVRIAGLSRNARLRRAYGIPLFGKFLRLVVAIARLPSLIKSVQFLEESLGAQLSTIESTTNTVAADAEDRIRSVGRALSEHLNMLSRMRVEVDESVAQYATARKELDKLAALWGIIEDAGKEKADVDRRLNQISEHQDSLSVRMNKLVETKFDAAAAAAIKQQLLDNKRSALDQQRRVRLILEELRKYTQSPPEKVEQVTTALAEEEKDHLLDAMYVTFEDRFRGTREEIKRRQLIYLPYVESVKPSLSTPLVDVGCGRGEWLEVLKDDGHEAMGVDINRLMINECQERGLSVLEGDAIKYLEGLKPGSLSAVTGFQIVEHLPLHILVRLLDESLRVLCPKGMIIFETPNPENIIVGACNFYMDPSHRNPLPPDMLAYLVEARGFVRCEIVRSNPMEVPSIENEFLRQLFSNPQDYSVIAYKA
jgi:O-antigen chain-terminating methyltransferase